MIKRTLLNRLGAAILTAAMLFTSVPMSVFADEVESQDTVDVEVSEEADTEELTEDAAAEETDAEDEEIVTVTLAAEDDEADGTDYFYRELTDEEIAAKERLSEDVASIQETEAGVDYVRDEVALLCDSEEEAEEVAKAYADATGYGIKVASVSNGVAVLKITEASDIAESIQEDEELTEAEEFIAEVVENTEAVEALVTIASNTDINLPAVYANFYRYQSISPAQYPLYTVNEAFTDPYLSYDDVTYYDNTYSWYHELVDSKFVWKAAEDGALDFTYASGTLEDADGNDVIVAVIDSGITANNASEFNIMSESTCFVEQADGSAIPGASVYVTDSADAHGTNVAAIAAGKANTDFGRGIAPGAKILALRVFATKDERETYGTATNSGSDAVIVRAINYAVTKGAKVVNMSLGGPGFSSLYAAAIDYAEANGVVLIAAAGNENLSGKAYPAAYEGVVNVASVNVNKEKSSFSNYGSTVDLAAPGGEMYPEADTYIGDTVNYHEEFLATPGVLEGATEFQHGTSQATPVVSGTAALIIAEHPDYTPAQVRDILKNSCTKANTSYAIGAGVINVAMALGVDNNVAAPTLSAISPAPGIVSGTGNVVYLETVTEYDMPNSDAVIYYTVNGKEPQPDSLYDPVYNKNGYTFIYDPSVGIALNKQRNYSIKAVALLYGKYSAPSETFNYTVDAIVNTLDIYAKDGGLDVIEAGSVVATAVNVGSKVYLACDFDPEYSRDKHLIWESSDTSVAIVNSYGTVMGVAECEVDSYGDYIPVTITATSADDSSVYGTYDIYVYPGFAILTIDETSDPVELEVGGANYNLDVRTSLNPTAPVVLDNSRIVDKFENNPEVLVQYFTEKKGVVKVLDDGTVIPLKSGEEFVIVAARDGSMATDRIKFKVSTPVLSVDIVDTNRDARVKDTVIEGRTLTPAVKYNTGYAAPDVPWVKWELDDPADEEFVTINPTSGVVAAKKDLYKDGKIDEYGQAVTIKATAKNGVYDTYTFTVYPAVTEIKAVGTEASVPYSKSSVYAIKAWEIFGISVEPSAGIIRDVLEYESTNKAVAVVASDGAVVPKGLGTATIVVRTIDGSGLKLSCKVSFTKEDLKSVGLVPNRPEVLYPGSSITYKISSNSNVDIPKPFFELAADDGTVTDGEISKYLKLDSTKGVVTGLTSLKNLPASPSTGVLGNGSLIYIYGGDKGNIYASSAFELYSAKTTKVVVEDSGIEIGKDGLELNTLGEVRQLDISSEPAGACQSHYTYKSSNPNVVKALDDGSLIAVGNGTANVTVTAGDGSNVNKTFKVTVAHDITAITVASANRVDVIGAKQKKQMVAILNDDAAAQKLTWSVDDTSLATIDAKGVLTAKSVSTVETVTVTASYTNKAGTPVSGTCSVDIYPEAVKKIQAEDAYGNSIKTVNALFGSDTVINVNTYDAASADDFTCYLSGAFVVDPGQLVTDGTSYITIKKEALLKAGTCTLNIVAADGTNKKAAITVKVMEPVTDLEIAGKNINHQLAVGAQGRMIVTEYNNGLTVPGMKDVLWELFTSDDSSDIPVDPAYVSITSGGVVKASAAAAGTTVYARATAKDGSGVTSAYYDIDIYAGKVNKVTLEDENAKAKSTLCTGSSIGDLDNSIELFASVGSKANPGDFGEGLLFASSNEAIAHVEFMGGKNILVTNNDNLAGKVTITAIAGDGTNTSAKYTVFVVNPVRDLKVRSVKGYYNLGLKGALDMKATATSYASNNKVEWSVSPANQGVVISNNGTIHVKPDAVLGTYTVTATALDGSRTTASHDVEVFENSEGIVITGNNVVHVGAEETFTVTTKNAGACQQFRVLYTNEKNGKAVYLDPDGTSFKVIGIAPGSITVMVTPLDGTGVVAKYTVKIVK